MKGIVTAVAVMACAFAQAAFAADTSVAVSGMAPNSNGNFVLKQAVVQYGDLNAADKEGAATLLTRINDAAQAVCKSNGGLSSRSLKAQVEKCQTRAVTSAVAAVGSPALTEAAAK